MSWHSYTAYMKGSTSVTKVVQEHGCSERSSLPLLAQYLFHLVFKCAAVDVEISQNLVECGMLKGIAVLLLCVLGEQTLFVC